MVIGITYIILYINLLTFGYTIKEYLEFLLREIECYLFPLGILLEVYAINIKKGEIKWFTYMMYYWILLMKD